MTEVLQRPRVARAQRASAAAASSDQLILPEATEYQDAGSRDKAQPWQGAKGSVRPRPAPELSNLSLNVDKDAVVVWQMGGMICLTYGGTADFTPWYGLRFALAASAFEITRVAEVRSYLDSHADMYGVTEEICKAARREFGPEAFLTLQVYHDPEIDDEYLVLYVRLRTYGPDTMSRIRSVADAFENELCQTSGSILMTTDFRPIR